MEEVLSTGIQYTPLHQEYMTVLLTSCLLLTALRKHTASGIMYLAARRPAPVKGGNWRERGTFPRFMAARVLRKVQGFVSVFVRHVVWPYSIKTSDGKCWTSFAGSKACSDCCFSVTVVAVFAMSP